jgi:hypothetical protein
VRFESIKPIDNCAHDGWRLCRHEGPTVDRIDRRQSVAGDQGFAARCATTNYPLATDSPAD